MENEWTFDEYGNEEWCHDSFESKQEAISEGLKYYKGTTIVVGQLISDGLNYRVENKEVIKSDYSNLIGVNHKNERVGFRWDSIGEELI